MNYIGDFAEDSTVNISFTTNDRDGAAAAPSSAFEEADFKIYKNNSATEKPTMTQAAGITVTSPFDSITGLHLLTIDTSDDDDAGFWAAGNDYTVILSPDETVDSQSVVAVLAQFSIENRFGSGTLMKKAARMLVNKAVQTKATGAIVYYDDDGVTPILTHTPTDGSSEITRTPS